MFLTLSQAVNATYSKCHVKRRQLDEICSKKALEYITLKLQKWEKTAYETATSYAKPEECIILDIETAGLRKTDAIWAIGIAYHQKGMKIEQLVADNPLEERLILDGFAEWCSKRPTLITFNGSFDISRLKYRMNSHAIKMPEIKNIEIYTCQWSRIAKEIGMRRATLQTFENLLFPEAKRENDLPGKEIPKAWKRYTQLKNPSIREEEILKLVRAVEHNAYDLVTQTALYLTILEKGR
ncbi:ribonuclease H-like domain-containing protein [Candidatus Woesearchaeota archaeon]|nr:ribonuclease H-like domain-containing protein [Candidatus Woesearchaeota archaeon]